MQALFAKVLGAVLLVVGLLGYAMDSPLLGLFGVTVVHNWVHILSGVVLLGAGFAADGMYAKWTNIVFGVVYLLVAVLGFANVQFVWDLLALNMEDNVLHLVIGAASVGVGFASD